VSSESTSPEEAIYNLSASVSPPREPSDYRITDHFRYRLNHRRNPSIDGEIVRRCFEEGRIKHTQDAERFFFELELDHRFRVVVELRDEAFLEEKEKHRALTVYAVGETHDVDQEWRP